MFKTIPLGKLIASPRNVRRHCDPTADAELKASILAQGLLQNLIVRPTTKGRFEVDAGERRRRAMVALLNDKLLARDHAVRGPLALNYEQPADRSNGAKSPVLVPPANQGAVQWLTITRPR